MPSLRRRVRCFRHPRTTSVSFYFFCVFFLILLFGYTDKLSDLQRFSFRRRNGYDLIIAVLGAAVYMYLLSLAEAPYHARRAYHSPKANITRRRRISYSPFLRLKSRLCAYICWSARFITSSTSRSSPEVNTETPYAIIIGNLFPSNSTNVF